MAIIRTKLPVVKALLNKLSNPYKRKVIVLMYHRIASPTTDPWQLAVSPQNFEQHLKVLKNGYNIISIPELARQLKNKKIEANSVCITFDDAYTDNDQYAKPLLKKYNLPAAFFVPAHFIGKDKPFWWDELESIILRSVKLPALFDISIGGEPVEFKLGNEMLTEEEEEKHRSWTWPTAPPTQRAELYLALWKRLQPLPLLAIESVLKQIRSWAGYTPAPDDLNFAMNNDQLQEMFNEPLFNMGIHTLTHPALAYHSKEVQRYEIEGCKKFLEQMSGAKIDTIAFPYGNYNDTTLSIVKDLNLSLAFTTRAGLITKSSDPYELGRLQVVNQGAKEFERMLTKWMK